MITHFFRTTIVKLALSFSTAIVLAACGEAAQGPLRTHPSNPHYFTDGTRSADGSLKVVYLTGSHTWNNLVDLSRHDEKFDFEGYLDFLEKHHHNFIRLWTWESTWWDTRANRSLGKGFILQAAPHPWARTGPGKALDGKPKFDLTEFNPEYFQRLRSRVAAAGERGIYVSIMLFEGWGLTRGNWRGPEKGWAWRSHPFNPSNNVNSIKVKEADALSGRVHTLANPRINELQAAYIRKVVDTVNDLDNVLYEVINEGGEQEWDWWVVKTIRDHEQTKPNHHPIGITGHGAENLESMLASPADWISPGSSPSWSGKNPPAWEGKKISLLDTDHIFGVGGNEDWVWKSFFGGHNPIFMDPYDGSVLGKPNDLRWEPIRNALGQTRRLAERIDLQAMLPHPELASTGFCLAQPGTEYLAYQPQPRATFSLTLEPGSYRFEWIDPAEGKIVQQGELKAVAGTTEFEPPMNDAAVLYVRAQ
jgi:hypothetical protein